ncbi:uncharacterized protein isoform X2 [Musca autumnalis]|uniref:uncharacterized protein isoform X2 n=1 Tax=Musca autumnalis TaxID=221902 RepID=UPI003CEED6EB
MVTNMADSDNCKCSDNETNSSSNNTKNPIKINDHTKYKQRHYAYKKQPTTFTLSLIIGIWCLFSSVTSIPGAAVYTNVDFRSNPTFEPICNQRQEHFIESDGKESSLILEFNRADVNMHQQSCSRILSAPPNYGFIIRLILPKIWQPPQYNSNNNKNAHRTTAAPSQGHGRRYARAATESSSIKNDDRSLEKSNTTIATFKIGRRCPLSIFSSHDPHTPEWRLDPCQLEDTAPEMEDPVRLFRDRVRIVWDHANQTLNSKLMVTVLGKGDQCRSENKHQCVKIEDEPLLCISKDLICDGIRHCPYSNQYDSDEDYAMCWKRSRLGEPVPPAMESDIFEHFALEVFRNLFAFDVPSIGKGTTKGINTTVVQKELNDEKTPEEEPLFVDGNNTANSNATHTGGHHPRRNGTRMGLNSDLSKYGPWGYLMLGMLLCGGALLICGLWASASQHAANNERESALQNANAVNAASGMAQDSLSTPAAPPNYEELDPPPAYSVLFPNQKAASSNTLNSLDVQGSVAHQQLSPSAAPSSRSTARTYAERAACSRTTATTAAHNN